MTGKSHLDQADVFFIELFVWDLGSFGVVERPGQGAQLPRRVNLLEDATHWNVTLGERTGQQLEIQGHHESSAYDSLGDLEAQQIDVYAQFDDPALKLGHKTDDGYLPV